MLEPKFDDQQLRSVEADNKAAAADQYSEVGLREAERRKAEQRKVVEYFQQIPRTT